MNERIFEVIQELNGRVGLLWTKEDKEEFAELIVRECIDVVSNCNLVDDDPILDIRKHFGVE
jgi:hypothetical protein